jgi:PBSX family phage terminase large subunit
MQSQTSLTGFNPNAIPYQIKVVNLIRRDWDYSTGTPEILLSGSYGSAKSILMAHLIVTHCLFNPGAIGLIARKAMPDLKSTIFKEIIEHISEDLTEGTDYWVNETNASIRFSNGSEIISRSWSDKRYKKGRSLKISFLVFEELTENNEEDKEAFMTLKARLRRLPHIKENVLIAATNPDSANHWVHRYFFDEKKETRFVFKSITTDNPFLDPIYIKQLKEDLDPIQALRYIYGEWVELTKDRVYYAYNKETNYKESFDINYSDELRLCHDFNIGHGKPMSAAAAVKIGKNYHIIKSFHVQGARTSDIMEEIASSGLLDKFRTITVYGDASGKNRDTRSIKSDYDIIKEFLANYRTRDGRQLSFSMKVPLANPPIRRRHNLVNAHFINENKEVRLYVYDMWLHDGFMQTSFKKGSNIEDDSLPEQHVTTAIGYMIDYDINRTQAQSKTIQL